MKAKYYILSRLHRYASAVLEETETSLTIQKLKVVHTLDEFSGNMTSCVCLDETCPPTTESKNDLTKVLSDVELTGKYWTVYEFLTGEKRKAVAESTEIA